MFKDKLRYKLKSSGNTYIDLAERLKVDPYEVHLWLSGRQEPSDSVKKHISSFLGTITKPNKDRMNFSEKMTNWRCKNDLTLVDMSRLTGINKSALKSYEDCIDFPSDVDYQRLKELIGLNLEVRSVGEKIAFIRSKHKLTQKEFGAKLGVKHATVSKWEIGTLLPKKDFVDQIELLYGVKL